MEFLKKILRFGSSQKAFGGQEFLPVSPDEKAISPSQGKDVYEKLREHLRNADPETQNFSLNIMRNIVDATRDRKVSHEGGWWAQVEVADQSIPRQALITFANLPVAEEALIAFANLPAVKEFLSLNGIAITPNKFVSWSYMIEPVSNPPIGSYGDMLKQAENAYKAELAREEEREKRIISDLKNPSL